MGFHLVLITFSIILSSCSFFGGTKKGVELKSNNSEFILEDASGQFGYLKEFGKITEGEKNKFVTKYQLKSLQDEKTLEQAIMISRKDLVDGLETMTPEISQFSVWFEGNKYFSEYKLEKNKKSVNIRLRSPEKKWNKDLSFKLPAGSYLTCYFAQIFECLKFSRYFHMSAPKESGKVQVLILWEGFPYINEQFDKGSDKAFSRGYMVFDEKMKEGFYRYALHFDNQVIFYLLKNDL